MWPLIQRAPEPDHVVAVLQGQAAVMGVPPSQVGDVKLSSAPRSTQPQPVMVPVARPRSKRTELRPAEVADAVAVMNPV
jgi:hypothetical protein